MIKEEEEFLQSLKKRQLLSSIAEDSFFAIHIQGVSGLIHKGHLNSNGRGSFSITIDCSHTSGCYQAKVDNDTYITNIKAAFKGRARGHYIDAGAAFLSSLMWEPCR